jgi:thiamine-phosphate pyrophosphorylase
MTPMPRSDPSRAILCYVTDRRSLVAAKEETAWAALQNKIADAEGAGVDWVQIREKDLAGRALVGLVRAAVGTAPRCRILVNDRLDVAIAAGAAGVHLGGDSLPVAEVVKQHSAVELPLDFLVGRSCHSLEEALAAEGDGADYIFFGPVFATPSKAEFGAPQGIVKLEQVCRRVGVAVLAIGGITVENAAESHQAGSAGIAAIRLFQEAADMGAVVSRLRAWSTS